MNEHVVDGLDGNVVITRDGHGIPLVTAHSWPDLFVGQGFATAFDRLGQMEWDRRRALGRTAELFGSPANVTTDAHHRRLRLADHARAGYAALDADTRAALDAYAIGVNAAAAATRPPIELATLGGVVEPWEPWTPILVFLVRHVAFATWQSKLWNLRVLAALGPDAVGAFAPEGRSGDTPIIVPSGVRCALAEVGSAFAMTAAGRRDLVADLAPLGLALSGSNAWALDTSRTSNGRPLVAGDPHRALELPNVYYQLHLRGPSIDASGISFVGIPGIQHFGQTAHAAWAVTNAMADYQDLFVERLPVAHLDRRVETIEVRDADPVDIECATTAHGPLIVGTADDGIGIALASTGLRRAGGSLRTILPFLRARSVADLADAIELWVEPANNFVLADEAGHIAYRTAGLIPRRDPLNRYLPVPGWDPTFEWKGMIPAPQLPAMDDPSNGAVVTANQRITDAPIGVELSTGYASPSRANRIWARLAERTELTVEDQCGIQADDVWETGLALATRVVAVGGEAAARLSGWDGRMKRTSEAATFVATVFDRLVARVTASLPDELRHNPFAGWEPPATARPPESAVAHGLGAAIRSGRDEIVTGVGWGEHLPASVDDALAEDPVMWGDRHRMTPRFALSGADPTLDRAMSVTSPPLAGGQDCVCATNQLAGFGTAAVTGSTARYVWDVGNRPGSRWIVPLGASGDPTSPHFTDQLGRWSAGELIPVLDDRVTSTLTLRP
ncbi:MAG: penicillin acylase family protein [Desertimonas sp.]